LNSESKYPESRYADTRYANTKYPDTKYADTKYADTKYADTKYADSSYTQCPDSSGTMPSCAPLAVPYVPFQQTGANRYNHTDALNNGTLYPSLNLPFHLKVDAVNLPSNPLTELQALEFVILELGLYLDTHPNDGEAFELFRQYVGMEREARRQYTAANGPLFKTEAAADKTYTWLKDPWPWQYTKGWGK